MKLLEIMQPRNAFYDNVRSTLWRNYQDDPFFPPGVEYPEMMDDEDYLDFEEHVKDIVKFAQQHRIQSPAKAVAMYDQRQHKEIEAEYRSRLQ